MKPEVNLHLHCPMAVAVVLSGVNEAVDNEAGVNYTLHRLIGAREEFWAGNQLFELCTVGRVGNDQSAQVMTWSQSTFCLDIVVLVQSTLWHRI